MPRFISAVISGEMQVMGLKMGFLKNHNRDSKLTCNVMFLFKKFILNNSNNNNNIKKKKKQKRKAFSPVSKPGFKVKKQNFSQSVVL